MSGWLTVTTRWARFSLVRCRRWRPGDAQKKQPRNALALDAQLAEAYSALGYVKHFNWNWTGSRAGLQTRDRAESELRQRSQLLRELFNVRVDVLMSRSRRRIARVSWIRFHCRSARREVSCSRTRVVTTRPSSNSAASLQWIRTITRHTGSWATRMLQISSLTKQSLRRRRRLTCLSELRARSESLGLAYGLAGSQS